jgi:hypothetical protein
VQSGSGHAGCRKGLILSNPQGPHQPAQPDARQQAPLPQHAPGGLQQPIPQFGPGQHGAPNYGAPNYGAPGQGQRQGQRRGQHTVKGPKKLWTVLGIVGGVLILALVGVLLLVNLVGGATNKAKGLADDFTHLVIAGETDRAYDGFLDPALQDKLSKEEFAEGVQSLHLDDSCKPTYNDLKASSENGNTSADVAGVITCDGKEVELAYRFNGGDDLKMINIKLKPKA